MNQGKLKVVKQEMARVNVDILGISELKWTGMGTFNSDANGVEIFSGDGSVMSVLLLPDQTAEGVEFCVENGTAQIVSLDAWRVNSIW